MKREVLPPVRVPTTLACVVLLVFGFAIGAGLVAVTWPSPAAEPAPCADAEWLRLEELTPPIRATRSDAPP